MRREPPVLIDGRLDAQRANHQAVAAQMRGGQVGGVASGGLLHGRGPPDDRRSRNRAPAQSDLDLQCPEVAFAFLRARYKIVTPGESSATKGCSRHGFVLALRCWHRPCSTRPF